MPNMIPSGPLQCVEAGFVISGKTIGKHELDFMGDTAVAACL
jgi:hypothetical protein